MCCISLIYKNKPVHWTEVHWTADIGHFRCVLYLQTGEFEWSRGLRGWVLSAFYVGYFLTQIPAGWIARKVGGKWLIGPGKTTLQCFVTLFLIGLGQTTLQCFVTLLLIGPGQITLQCFVTLLLIGPGQTTLQCFLTLLLIGPGQTTLQCFLTLLLIGPGQTTLRCFQPFNVF